MSDQIKHTTGCGKVPIPQRFHYEAQPGYPPIRRPNLTLVGRPWGGPTDVMLDYVHDVPVIRTGRFRRRVLSPPEPYGARGAGYSRPGGV